MELVRVKKVRFGSMNFMFFRTTLNIALRERERLNYTKANPERHRWLSNTIRAMAANVFFSREKRIEGEIAAQAPKTIQKQERQKTEAEIIKEKIQAELKKQTKLF
jgi:hypothetical protein